jgi:beta-glucosidase
MAGDGDGATTVADDPDGSLPRSEEFFGYGSIEVTQTIECTAGVPVPLVIRWASAAGTGFAAIRVGIRPPEPADLMDRAVRAAADADVAVVVVGTNDEWETAGQDRSTMDLPGRQDELVARVVEANPRTVVVVNAGSPVTMDWAAGDGPDAARAVLTPFFGGQEQAEAVVDVILGDADPGGRLPVTYPVRLADHPAFEFHRPEPGLDGPPRQTYGEGLFVGYRSYDQRALAPRFPFGHGLSYGEADWGEPTASATHGSPDSIDVTLSIPITATGDRSTTVVVQVYVAPVDPPVSRPTKELRGWAKLVVAAGASAVASVRLDADAFRRWDDTAGTWTIDPGAYDLVVAASATDERARVRFDVTST